MSKEVTEFLDTQTKRIQAASLPNKQETPKQSEKALQLNTSPGPDNAYRAPQNS